MKEVKMNGSALGLGLGIETSCDETSVSVVAGGSKILSNSVYSQISEHAPFRGVVPEIASRSHLEKINSVYHEAITKAAVLPEDIEYVSVSSRPGLVGSLMVGAQFAKCFSMVYDVPLIALNHLEAHFYSLLLEDRFPDYPFLGLLLSGGNSSIYIVHDVGKMELIADTYDDAIGEAFDKTAAVLSLPYPGGPEIEKCAGRYLPSKGAPPLFGRLLKGISGEDLGFSFSGIKTAVLRANHEKREKSRICHDFQNSVFELVERMVIRAVNVTGIRCVVASGGVLANETLRLRLKKIAEREGLDIRHPVDRILCTDNAGMVAALGFKLWISGFRSEFNFSVSSKRFDVAV